MITVKELKEFLAQLPEGSDDLELKYDNGFDYNEIQAIRPKYSPDLRNLDKPIFLAIM
ncbi:MAG: hypothetical protein IK114_14205 [Fibrobacter sp.]|nr:hypothetical protein [Fibrobacter sp.]